MENWKKLFITSIVLSVITGEKKQFDLSYHILNQEQNAE